MAVGDMSSMACKGHVMVQIVGHGMQGIGDIYTGPRMLEQRMASQGMAFGQQQQHAIDPGSYGQLGTQLQGSFGQPSQRRSQAARCLSSALSKYPWLFGWRVPQHERCLG